MAVASGGRSVPSLIPLVLTSGGNQVSRVPEWGWLFRSQRRFVGRMGVKRPEMGSKRRFLGEFATWVITAQLLLRTIFMSRVAFHESQARIRRKFRIRINLRRKHGSPNFCKKPENVAFRSMLTPPGGGCCTRLGARHRW